MENNYIEYKDIFNQIWSKLNIANSEVFTYQTMTQEKCMLGEFPSATKEEMLDADFIICDYIINTPIRHSVTNPKYISSGMVATLIFFENDIIKHKSFIVWQNEVSLNAETFKYYPTVTRLNRNTGDYYYDIFPKQIFLPLMSILYPTGKYHDEQRAETLFINSKNINKIEIKDNVQIVNNEVSCNTYVCEVNGIQFYLPEFKHLNTYLEPLDFDKAAEFYLKLDKFKEGRKNELSNI